MQMKDFQKTDWYGWAGAEKPDEHTEPKIGYIKLDQGEFPQCDGTMIADKNGLSLNVTDEELHMQFFQKAVPFHEAVKIAEALDEEHIYNHEDLARMGFEWVC